MKALLIIAHGSRLQASNDEVVTLRDTLEPMLEMKFSQLKVAYLELCEPSISQAINALMACDVTEIVVMPYFLNKGRHVTQDVPDELEQMRIRYPDLTITALPYFGQSRLIPSLLKNIIDSHV